MQAALPTTGGSVLPQKSFWIRFSKLVVPEECRSTDLRAGSRPNSAMNVNDDIRRIHNAIFFQAFMLA